MKNTKKEAILKSATEKFPDQKLRLRHNGGETELLVGESAEHCYRVEELEHGSFDFEQMD